MFGDDPDPTIMTEWVGFGTTFGRVEGSEHCVERDKTNVCKCVVGLGAANERNGEKRGAATTSGCKF